MDPMSLKDISPDQVILWQWGFIRVNATLIFTWMIMAVLVLASWLATRRLSTSLKISRWQNLLEVVIPLNNNCCPGL